MNFCTKCSSYYQTPGTCNCFAPAQVAPYIQPAPFTPCPYPTTVPWYPPYPITTITWGSSATTTELPDGWYIWNKPTSQPGYIDS